MIQFTFTFAALEYYLCDAISFASGSHQREPFATHFSPLRSSPLPCTAFSPPVSCKSVIALAVAVTAAIQNVAIINSV